MALLARLTGSGRSTARRISKNNLEDIDLNIFDNREITDDDSEAGNVESKESEEEKEIIRAQKAEEAQREISQSADSKRDLSETIEDIKEEPNNKKEEKPMIVNATIVPSAEEQAERAKQREERLELYRREISDTRASIVSQREMWEKLVKDSEAQVRQLREELAKTREERDTLRAKVSSGDLEYRQKTNEFTENLIRQKMRAAELGSEIDMFKHHAQLFNKRREQFQLKQKTSRW
eukprot:CAMPEP_0197292168 /NCGR_PEP_ID=MMETSP0890-20130614/21562_1 /TAXON_ID=44058 ORGANISM="Aureoumbra lagunensis, Strain CCMP1510" /NCGR_SAMPLE_ID=MMETSP0890 /ASSEMBLY_ACC=CAM_ASM_000533 /LENGTH=235 /DNA_ID=CAMNT_0042765859 /DNA_START=190 /DNA_END=894 /DNA_ORIENTATION=-